MLTEIVMAGSGGQGIQFAGQILAQAAVRQGLNATYNPSYGAERRGGTSYCSVVIADELIYAPVFPRPDVLLCFDQRGRHQYGPAVKSGGLILANQDLASVAAAGEAAGCVVALPASTLAERICRDGALNLVMLGAYVTLAGLVAAEQVRTLVTEKSRRRPELLASNLEALALGETWMKEHRP
jgi:2-oxoglutarate ferredoxin oxidoreductase subunit gamma